MPLVVVVSVRIINSHSFSPTAISSSVLNSKTLGTICCKSSNNAARTVVQELGDRVDSEIWDLAAFMDRMEKSIKRRDPRQMNDSGALEKIIDEVMAANAPMVEQFRAGKDKAFNALVGLVMKASKGKANPQQANELLKQKLQG